MRIRSFRRTRAGRKFLPICVQKNRPKTEKIVEQRCEKQTGQKRDKNFSHFENPPLDFVTQLYQKPISQGRISFIKHSVNGRQNPAKIPQTHVWKRGKKLSFRKVATGMNGLSDLIGQESSKINVSRVPSPIFADRSYETHVPEISETFVWNAPASAAQGSAQPAKISTNLGKNEAQNAEDALRKDKCFRSTNRAKSNPKICSEPSKIYL